MDPLGKKPSWVWPPALSEQGFDAEGSLALCDDAEVCMYKAGPHSDVELFARRLVGRFWQILQQPSQEAR